ncbi:Radial spoke head 10 homolog B [Durusdinium trenchii]|uniref:Radial spoke head 10 homolog B n=1 Tax=Durusdinium trenchii TaxID=1381693 RepID=A0ABP0P885_9DINO
MKAAAGARKARVRSRRHSLGSESTGLLRMADADSMALIAMAISWHWQLPWAPVDLGGQTRFERAAWCCSQARGHAGTQSRRLEQTRRHARRETKMLSACSAGADGRFLAGFAVGETWLLDLTTPATTPTGSSQVVDDGRRAKLGEAGATNRIQEAGVKVECCAGRFVLVGVKRGSKTPLQIYDVGDVLGKPDKLAEVTSESLALPVVASTKLRGLGAVQEMPDGSLLVACGRGIGKAHVWRCRIRGQDCSMEYNGSMTASANTIEAMAFSKDGDKLVTVAVEGLTQLWNLRHNSAGSPEDAPFELRPAQAQRLELSLASVESVLGDRERSERLLEEVDRFSSEPKIQDWVQRKGYPWTVLFPPRLLDPSVYDGDVDEAGRPHGFGIQQTREDPGLVYDGEWRHGRRHGRGQLIDDKSGRVVYIGGWKDDVRHGFGVEVRGGSHESGESYEGWWRNGERHGLGVLFLSKRDSGLRSTGPDKMRISYVGFFKNGQRHGLGWWTWPAGSPMIPFSVSLESVAYMGSIRCIVRYEEGKFFNEFNFHRADGQPISEDEQRLLNLDAKRLKSKFAVFPDGHWTGEECWACLEQVGEDAGDANHLEMLECGNPACCMRVHRRCLGKTALRFARVSEARKRFGLEDSQQHGEGPNPESSDSQDDSGQLDTSVWFCPRKSCRKAMAAGIRAPFRGPSAARAPLSGNEMMPKRVTSKTRSKARAKRRRGSARRTGGRKIRQHELDEYFGRADETATRSQQNQYPQG